VYLVINDLLSGHVAGTRPSYAVVLHESLTEADFCSEKHSDSLHEILKFLRLEETKNINKLEQISGSN